MRTVPSNDAVARTSGLVGLKAQSKIVSAIQAKWSTQSSSINGVSIRLPATPEVQFPRYTRLAPSPSPLLPCSQPPAIKPQCGTCVPLGRGKVPAARLEVVDTDRSVGKGAHRLLSTEIKIVNVNYQDGRRTCNGLAPPTFLHSRLRTKTNNLKKAETTSARNVAHRLRVGNKDEVVKTRLAHPKRFLRLGLRCVPNPKHA